MAALPEQPTAPDRDEELVRLVVATSRRDRVAFRRLYDCTAPTLLGIATALLRRSDLAEEVVQDAYLKVWFHAGEYHVDRGRVMTWLISIVRYRAIDLLRRQRRAERFDAPDAGGTTGVPNPVELAAGMRDVARLTRCLGELSEPQSRSIVLAFIEGLTHAELAQRLGAPLGTIKTWIRRGLSSLRECLET